MFAVDNLFLQINSTTMKQKATLKNLSKTLNISISTVSRALKNHPDISDETKKKVKELAALMDYEPNTYAINLRTNKSNILGVIVPEISNFFYHSFIAAIEEEARRLNYMLLILQSANNAETELENLKLCRMNRVAGVFVALTSHTKEIRPFLQLEETGTPIIFCDKVPDFEACNKICSADAEATIISANAILKSNKRKVLAVLGNIDLSITKKREQVFKETLENSKEKISLEITHANSSEEATHKTLQYLSNNIQRPEVIFCMSDEILTGVMKAIYQTELKVPKDISVIAISNGFLPTLFSPEITHVVTSGIDLGKLAFKRMMDYQSGKTFAQELTIRARFVEGGSL
jgi:LacI family transcriptional regulator